MANEKHYDPTPVKAFPYYARIHWFKPGDTAGYTDSGRRSLEQAKEYARLRSIDVRGEIEVIVMQPSPHVQFRFIDGQEAPPLVVFAA